jgi:hypothetical protein
VFFRAGKDSDFFEQQEAGNGKQEASNSTSTLTLQFNFQFSTF